MTVFGGRNVLVGSMLLGFIGMTWLSQLSVGASYLGGLALPMMLIGIGQGGALGPLTTSGIADVAAEDAGAASGLVNVAHQLGSSLGLGVQIAASVFGSGVLSGIDLLAYRFDNAMVAAAAMVIIALVVVLRTFPHSRPSSSSHKTAVHSDNQAKADVCTAPLRQCNGD